MGHIYVKAIFYNAVEYVEYLLGKRRIEEVRKSEVEALVDTGATFPALPEEFQALVGILQTPIIGSTLYPICSFQALIGILLTFFACLYSVLISFNDAFVDLLYKP